MASRTIAPLARLAALATAGALVLGACSSSKGGAVQAGKGPVGGVTTPGATGATTAPSSTGTGSANAGTANAGTATTGTIGPASTAPSSRPPPVATTTSAPGPTTTLAPLPVVGSGANGTITAGPTCPVERAGQPCPPQPVQADIDARDGSGRTVASTHSDSAGRYALSLAPGSYTLVVVTSNGWPRCPQTPVTVHPGQVTRADISCDTGIR